MIFLGYIHFRLEDAWALPGSAHGLRPGSKTYAKELYETWAVLMCRPAGGQGQAEVEKDQMYCENIVFTTNSNDAYKAV